MKKYVIIILLFVFCLIELDISRVSYLSAESIAGDQKVKTKQKSDKEIKNSQSKKSKKDQDKDKNKTKGKSDSSKDKKSKKKEQNKLKNEPDKIIRKDNVELLRVVDGDTIEVLLEGREVKVRLLGIQAPELFANPVWDYAQEAKDALDKIFLYSKKVSLEYSSNHKNDKYGRILADVFSDDDIWINGYLVDKSFAYVYLLNYDVVPYIDKLLKLENKAIDSKLNIWSKESYRVIKANRAYQFVDFYKIVDGEILDVKITKNSIWLEMEQSKEKGLSARISKEDIERLGGIDEIKKYKNKKVRIRGFVEKYSPKFGPLIDIKSKYQIEIK